MRYATVSSGISAESAAWVPLGWEPVWYSEIAKFPSAVLAHHYPNTPNLGDMTKIHEDERFQQSIGTIDLISGGTPCQSFSVAGLRKGMADPRGNLALTYLGIVDKLRPRWVVWENVPGVLSSNKGRDFGAFLGALGQLGYGWAYRILDAQHFGVPQRRRRVFVVGHIGGWRRAAAVLFEPESLLRHSTPGRKAGQGAAGRVAPCLNGNGRAAGSATQQDAENGALVYGIVAGALCAGDFKSQSDQQAANGKLIATVIKGAAIGRKPENGPQYGEVLQDGSCYTLNCTERHAVAFAQNQIGEVRTGDSDGLAVYGQHAVRRLTPRECERLQGFPDVKKNAYIYVCKKTYIDRQKTCVDVETKNRKSQKSALIAEGKEHNLNASNADHYLSTSHLGQEKPVAINVHIDLEAKTLRIHKAKKSNWCVSFAANQNLSHHLIRIGDFVQLLALIVTTQEKITQCGKEGLLPHIKHSLVLKNGSKFVNSFGLNTGVSVKDAEKSIMELEKSMKYTTLEVGQSFLSLEKNFQTLLSFATNVISSFIPEEIKARSLFALNIEMVCGFTRIPYRGKPASKCPDGPRYKALGNSMAVPVVKWIGERIEMVDKIKSK